MDSWVCKWLVDGESFRLDVRHKPGKEHIVPDALSRLASSKSTLPDNHSELDVLYAAATQALDYENATQAREDLAMPLLESPKSSIKKALPKASKHIIGVRIPSLKPFAKPTSATPSPTTPLLRRSQRLLQ